MKVGSSAKGARRCRALQRNRCRPMQTDGRQDIATPQPTALYVLAALASARRASSLRFGCSPQAAIIKSTTPTHRLPRRYARNPQYTRPEPIQPDETLPRSRTHPRPRRPPGVRRDGHGQLVWAQRPSRRGRLGLRRYRHDRRTQDTSARHRRPRHQPRQWRIRHGPHHRSRALLARPHSRSLRERGQEDRPLSHGRRPGAHRSLRQRRLPASKASGACRPAPSKTEQDALDLKSALARRYVGSRVIEFASATGYWVRIDPVRHDRTEAAAIKDWIGTPLPQVVPYLVRVN